MPVDKLFQKKPAAQSTFDFIVSQLENAIIDHGLKPGDKLPPIRTLQELMGTSQGTLREALRILAQKGLIEAKPGRSGGLYVKAVSSNQISESLGLLIRQEQISLEHLFVFRSTLEVSAASLAAMNAKEKDVEHLRKLMTDSKKCLKSGVKNWKRFYKLEDRMHRALARMTENPLFESVLITVYENCPGYNYQLVPSKSQHMKDTHEDWRQLIEAIETSRPDKAGWIMTRHIQRFLPFTQPKKNDRR